MPLSTEERLEIVFLRLHPLGPKLSFNAIAEYMKCSKQTVITWVKRYEESQNVENQKGSGRKRKTEENQDFMILKRIKSYPEESSIQLSQYMKGQSVDISPRTIRRRLAEAGFRYGVPIGKPLLTEDHINARFQWAMDHRNFDFSKAIFTDESTFFLFSNKHKIWQPRGARKVFRTVKHPTKVHVWGCLSENGFGELYCFTSNLNAQLLCKIYKKALLPSVKKLFGSEDPEWWLVEDNDPKHRSKVAKELKKQKKIKILQWPSQSPDINCIENVWGLLKTKMTKYRCSKVSSFVRALKKEWKNLSQDYSQALVKSMKRRIEALIEAKGDYTIY